MRCCGWPGREWVWPMVQSRGSVTKSSLPSTARERSRPGWLPRVAAIKELAPDLRGVGVDLPCLYASGTEVDVILRMPGVDAVVGPREFSLHPLGAACRAHGVRRAGVSCSFWVGSLYLAARLAKRLGYPAVAYTEGYINTPGAFSRVFVPRETSREKVTAKGVPKERGPGGRRPDGRRGPGGDGRGRSAPR